MILRSFNRSHKSRLVLAVFLLSAIGVFSVPASSQPEGGALAFKSGQDDFVRVPSHPSLNSSEFTIEMWVRRESPLLEQHCVIYRSANGIGQANGLVLTYGYLGQDNWTLFINGCPLTGTMSQPLGSWVHLAVVFDGLEAFLYVNGEVDIHQFYPATLLWDSDLYFGVELDCVNNCFDSDQAHAGLIDDIRVWSIPRSQGQIQAGISGELDDPQFLAGRWTFHEPGGLVVNDLSGRSNHALLGIPAGNPGPHQAIDPNLIPDRILVAIAGSVDSGISDPADVLFLNGSSGGINRSIFLDVDDPIQLTMIAPPSGPSSANFALFAYFDGVTSPTRLPDDLGWTAFPTTLTTSRDQNLLTLVNNLGTITDFGFPLFERRPAPTTVLRLSQGTQIPMTVCVQGLIRDNASAHLDRISVTNSIDIHVR